MILPLKLLSLSSDSTKMPFLPAIRPPALIRLWIVTPHAKLHVESQRQHMQIYYRIHSAKSP